MNYEDRDGLQPPEQVVGAKTLATLAAASRQAGALGIWAQPPSIAATVVADDIEILTKRESAGGPPEAARVGRAALERGFATGMSLMGRVSQVAEHSLVERLDEMYVYELPLDNEAVRRALPAVVLGVLGDAGVSHDEAPALDDYIGRLWYFGLALAVLLSDGQ